MLYSTAARAEEVLRLEVADLDRANRRARTLRKGGAEDQLLDDIRTARLLGQLLGRRQSGPVFLSSVETPTASLEVTQPRDIRLYATMFPQLQRSAVYGADARALVTHAMADLASDWGTTP